MSIKNTSDGWSKAIGLFIIIEQSSFQFIGLFMSILYAMPVWVTDLHDDSSSLGEASRAFALPNGQPKLLQSQALVVKGQLQNPTCALHQHMVLLASEVADLQRWFSICFLNNSFIVIGIITYDGCLSFCPSSTWWNTRTHTHTHIF